KVPGKKVQASCRRGIVRLQDACIVQTGIFNPRSRDECAMRRLVKIPMASLVCIPYTFPMDKMKTQQRKPGPVPVPKTERYQLLIESELAEWGKQQPGGLSELVRRLLKEAYQQAHPERTGR